MKIKEKAEAAKAWAKEHKTIVCGAIGAAVTAAIGGGIAVKTLLDKHEEFDGDMPDDYKEEQCQIGYNGRVVPALLQVLSDDEAAFWVDPKELNNNEKD